MTLKIILGLYPETHGIVGNQFYDQEVHAQTKASCKAFFNIDDERTTEEMKWWQKVSDKKFVHDENGVKVMCECTSY